MRTVQSTLRRQQQAAPRGRQCHQAGVLVARKALTCSHARRAGAVTNSLANSNLLRNYRIIALVRHRLRRFFVVDVHKWVL